MSREHLVRELDFEDQRRDALMAQVDQIRYTNIVLSQENAFRFSPQDGLVVPRVNPGHPFYLGQHSPFDLEQYQYPRPPIDLGHSRVSTDTLGNVDWWKAVPNVLRLPIKYPKTEYRVPVELYPLNDLIQRVAEYEISMNYRHNDCLVHITLDRTKVEANSTHRYPGFHGDGLQGSKFSQRTYTPIEHSYIITSAPSTEFCLQPFFFQHLNDGRNNIFHEMEVQAREANVFGTIPWHLYLLDPYMVHRTPYVNEVVDRVFIRITYAYSELMNPHNTMNPLFEGQEYEERHDIRKFLTIYPAEVPWEMYGFAFGPKSADRE